jgi:DNA replication ATP-dependent helicase Dna2
MRDDSQQFGAREHECFLCSLDPQRSCSVTQIEGHIVAVREHAGHGGATPAIILDTATTRVELQLEHQYYHSLIKTLKALGDVISTHHLRVRIHHLPTPARIVEHNGRVKHCYMGNAYTLAVLEPDTLLNITDLSQAEYCSRQYLLNRLASSPASPATLRGNIVHHCFKELLTAYDRGQLTTMQDGDEESSPRASLRHSLEQALEFYSIDMALAHIDAETMHQDVMPHLDNLAQWFSTESNTLWNLPAAYSDQSGDEHSNQVRAETFLLAPEIGLRGRLDLFWQQSGRERLLELKTGGAKGKLPKDEHRWQVYGYHALLAVRRDSKMKKALATLLYSDTPRGAEAFGIPGTIRELQRVNERRNLLVLSRVTGRPPDPPGPTRCTKCSMLDQCQRVSHFLDWKPPEPDPDVIAERDALRAQQANENDASTSTPDTSADGTFFNTYYQLLQEEGRAGEQQQALLWQTPVTTRIEQGSAIAGLEPISKPIVHKDGWAQTFRCTNASELREGDEILLSNSSPISGEVVTGTILALNPEQVSVWTRERLAHPTLIDRYDNDLVHVRTLQNLLRWLQTDAPLRNIITDVARQPRFTNIDVPARTDFNTEQNLAVERALQMQDYLLIQGPPGTGKTSVIAEIVKRLVTQGQRVLLAAFTNQAVDNMLKRLDKEGFHDYLRLGQERSVDQLMHGHLLKNMIEQTDNEQAAADMPTRVHTILYTTPVVASTTATWSSDKYTSRTHETTAEQPGLSFDVAIIDEAGQLTVPAILGALRFARRFVLVGDEQQLPPLVLSEEAARRGLSTSLFHLLQERAAASHVDQVHSSSACIPLRTQYRMNQWISNFSSTVFYDKALVAHESIAHRQLTFQSTLLQQTSVPESPAIINAIQPARPLVFLDVSKPQTDFELLAAVQEPKMSTLEAETVRDLVAALLARGIAEQDIGIIAPYRAQVANIRRHLFQPAPERGWQALPVDTPLTVDTVDRFQGGERLVMIMSFATSIGPAAGTPRRDFLTNGNRLNVALTRAQRKLILVGHVSALEHLPIFSRLITYCRSMKALFSCWET